MTSKLAMTGLVAAMATAYSLSATAHETVVGHGHPHGSPDVVEMAIVAAGLVGILVIASVLTAQYVRNRR